MSQPSPSKSTESGRETGSGEGRQVGDEPVESDRTADDTAATEDLRALYLDSDDAGELISSLSSETARSILVALHDRPATASELAETVDTSVQNVRHHLDNLSEADLVRAADTRYSSKGREMDVYAPVDRPLVVVVGNEDSDREDDTETDDGEGFVDSLSRFVGAVVGLAAASLLVQSLVVPSVGGDLAGVVRSPDAVGGAAGVVTAPPGLLFFAGGAVVLATVSLWRYRRRTQA
jgi:DNA-binding transcriptional ArsR family regulator